MCVTSKQIPGRPECPCLLNMEDPCWDDFKEHKEATQSETLDIRHAFEEPGELRVWSPDNTWSNPRVVVETIPQWLWVRNRYPKWNPGKWKRELKPAVPEWFNFDPYPNNQTWGDFRLDPLVNIIYRRIQAHQSVLRGCRI